MLDNFSARVLVVLVVLWSLCLACVVLFGRLVIQTRRVKVSRSDILSEPPLGAPGGPHRVC